MTSRHRPVVERVCLCVVLVVMNRMPSREAIINDIRRFAKGVYKWIMTTNGNLIGRALKDIRFLCNCMSIRLIAEHLVERTGLFYFNSSFVSSPTLEQYVFIW